jgi:hypothetical protein
VIHSEILRLLAAARRDDLLLTAARTRQVREATRRDLFAWAKAWFRLPESGAQRRLHRELTLTPRTGSGDLPPALCTTPRSQSCL